MNKCLPVLAILAAGALLAGCSGKSYTYEVSLQVAGQGSAEVTVVYPGGPDDKSPKGKVTTTTQTVTLPYKQKALAIGLGHVSIAAKSADGKAVTCAITVEQEDTVRKDGTGSARCETDITEDTKN
jgi:hypothetical protein